MRHWLYLSLLSLVLGHFFATSASAQFRSVRIQIIDRGQADGILIRTLNEKWVVINAGCSGRWCGGSQRYRRASVEWPAGRNSATIEGGDGEVSSQSLGNRGVPVKRKD